MGQDQAMALPSSGNFKLQHYQQATAKWRSGKSKSSKAKQQQDQAASLLEMKAPAAKPQQQAAAQQCTITKNNIDATINLRGGRWQQWWRHQQQHQGIAAVCQKWQCQRQIPRQQHIAAGLTATAFVMPSLQLLLCSNGNGISPPAKGKFIIFLKSSNNMPEWATSQFT